ncbi:hypothetical protein RJ639_043844, partial [Escallonia herrerae]
HLWPEIRASDQKPAKRRSQKMTEAYGEAWYWDKRYEREAAEGGAPFDWYQKYQSLAPLLRLYVPPHHRVLVVGCGNSAFSEGMVDDGYRDVVNVDISSVVIEAMQKKYFGNPHLKLDPGVGTACCHFRDFLADMRMDVRDMSAFQKGSFNAVVDKGTLDSLLCGHNSRENAAKMLEEVGRYVKVLKDKGIYILVFYLTLLSPHPDQLSASSYYMPLSTFKYSADNIRCSKLSTAFIERISFVDNKTACDRSCINYRAAIRHCSYTGFEVLHLMGLSLHAEKLRLEERSERQTRELTSPISLDGCGSSVEKLLGKNSDVHYIYVCIKDDSQVTGLRRESAIEGNAEHESAI